MANLIFKSTYKEVKRNIDFHAPEMKEKLMRKLISLFREFFSDFNNQWFGLTLKESKYKKKKSRFSEVLITFVYSKYIIF